MSWSDLPPRTRPRPLLPRRAAVALMLGGAAALGLPALSGCGFRPLYGAASPSGQTAGQLAQVEIARIPDRTGQLLRTYLIRLFNPGGRPETPLYRLDVSVQEARQNLGIAKDATATRANLLINGTAVLFDLRTGAALYQRPVGTITSFNILQDEFATLTAERDARDRALRQIATDIQTQIALYFNREI